MNQPPESLRTLQSWMQRAITQPHGLWATTDASEIEATIAPSLRQSATQRLAIYQQAYFARLVDVLRAMFPALALALEPEAFDALALAFLEQHPPRSYTLDRLSEPFVDFLVTTRPPRNSTTAATPDWADFMIDLARLEVAIDDVFDGPGSESELPLAASTFAGLTPATMGELRLGVAPCVRLLAFAFPLSDWYTAYRQGAQPPLPRPAASWLALHRRDYVVQRLPLDLAQYTLLSALAAGQSLGAAIDALAPLVPSEELATKLAGWFQAWAAARMFTASSG